MPKFDANLSLMYQEYDFLDRFAAAARDGFKGVEFHFPYGVMAGDIKTRLEDVGLTAVLFNCPPGDWMAGERGIASIPGREKEFKRGLERAFGYANALSVTRLHVMAGIVDAEEDRALRYETYLSNLAYAAHQAAAHGITILIEPINTRDMPGYFLNRQDEAQAVRKAVGAPNLKVLFDCYHCQIIEGDLETKLRRDIAGIGHIQIAGVPGRHEPDQGEINYPYLFRLFDELRYDGWVGCEYHPRARTSQGLSWLR